MVKKPMIQMALFLVLAAVLCSSEIPQPANRPHIKIMATVFPLLEFARAVAGERGEVSLLLPPGADVHTWHPKVSDMEKLASADLLIFIGADLEPWLADMLRSISGTKLRTLEASRGISLLAGNGRDHPGEEGHKMDPHIWLDFNLDGVIVELIQKRLAEIDPENAAYFQQGAASCIARLKNLDAEYASALSRCRHRTIIFGGHSAFAYLARRYQLVQIPVYGLSPDAAPTPRQLVEVIGLAKAEHVQTIFFETSVSDKVARLIAGEVGAGTSLLQAGHNLTKEQWRSGVTFFELMKKNLESLKRGLGCD